MGWVGLAAMDECSDPLDVILIPGKCHGCVRGLFILARFNRPRVTRLSFSFMTCEGAHQELDIVSATRTWKVLLRPTSLFVRDHCFCQLSPKTPFRSSLHTNFIDGHAEHSSELNHALSFYAQWRWP